MDGVNHEGLDHAMRALEIVRVQNGWVLNDPGMAIRTGHYTPRMVARTPAELAGLVTDWASRQEDADATLHSPL